MARGAKCWRGVVFATVLASVALYSVGCSAASEIKIPSIGYAFDNVVSSYNARTTAGAQSGALAAFGRVQPGFSYLGPDGTALRDTDIGTATSVPGPDLTVQYAFNPLAKYSDGVPMTCDDIVLAWIANSGRYTRSGPDGAVLPLFDAASTAGYSDIDRIDCQPGSKVAVVTFKPGRAYSNWASLFGATDLLPSHVAQRIANVPNLEASVAANDQVALGRVAQFWNTGWTLVAGSVDENLLPSAGPYRVDSFTPAGGLVLVANDTWWGDKPATARIVIWPKGTDLAPLEASGDLDVIDAGAQSSTTDTGNGLEATTRPTFGVEQLTLSTGGVLTSADARRALALCVPRQQLFDSLAHPGADPAASELGSGIVDARTTDADTLIYPSVAATSQNRYAVPDVPAAIDARTRSGQGSMSIRIGYLGPDQRRAETVKDIASSCAPAGIDVIDASLPQFQPSALGSGQVDAVLGGTAALQGPSGESGDGPAAALRTGSAQNYGRYSNGRVDQILDQLQVDTVDSDRLALSVEAEAILWTDLPTLPLFDQPRTLFVSRGMTDVVANPTAAGAGWNMDRWILQR